MLSLLKSSLKRRKALALEGNRYLRLLNLGCGTTIHSAWDNYDFSPALADVKKIDLGKRLSFPSSFYDACYLSHVLEHLSRQRAPQLLYEIRDALKPGGVIRVVVPDLENIVRLYITQLEAAASGDRTAIKKHEWMTLELIDQMTRTFSGGFMGRTMRSRPLPHHDFIQTRLGCEARRWIESLGGSAEGGSKTMSPSEVYHVPEIDTAEEAKFRRGGEVHRWMYDRVSLQSMLEGCGYSNITICRADQSRISHFASYNLDTDETGSVRKPDSLFVEAIKVV